MRKHLRRPSPAMVVACLALFIALSAGGYAATGGNFILGQANSATSQTGLTSNNAGKALNVTQQNTGAGATALGLNVPAGKPPLTVNSGVKVANLNSDRLDGMDSTGFLRNVIPLSLSGSHAVAVVQGTNSGSGNGVQGTTASWVASGVYGENNGGGAGVAGRSNQPGGTGIYGEALDPSGFAGQFAGRVRIDGSLEVTSTAKVTNLNADRLDGMDSTGFIQGGGKATGQAISENPGEHFMLGPPLLGFLRVSYACPANVSNDGVFKIYNDSGSAANVFVESGGANPTYGQLAPLGQLTLPAAATGDSFHIQAQGAPGILTIEAATVHRASGCHAQVQALLTS